MSAPSQGKAEPASGVAPTAEASSAPTRVQLARLWMPWVALGVSAGLACLLAVWCIASCIGAWQTLADREASLAALAAGASPGVTVGVGAVDPAGGGVSAEDAAEQLVADASRLLEHVEALAAGAGVVLLQFLPETAPAGKAPDVVRLQLRGTPTALEALLLSLGEPAPAIELATMRLAAGPVADQLLCELGLRLHDAASLARLGGKAVVPEPTAWSDHASLIPTGVFGTPGPLRSAAEAASHGLTGPAMAHQRVAHPEARPDPLAGMRLLGLLRKGEHVAVLLDSPATGPVLLRRSEPLGLTGFRLQAAAAGRATLANDVGERRVLELDATVPGAE